MPSKKEEILQRRQIGVSRSLDDSREDRLRRICRVPVPTIGPNGWATFFSREWTLASSKVPNAAKRWGMHSSAIHTLTLPSREPENMKPMGQLMDRQEILSVWPARVIMLSPVNILIMCKLWDAPTVQSNKDLLDHSTIPLTRPSLIWGWWRPRYFSPTDMPWRALDKSFPTLPGAFIL